MKEIFKKLSKAKKEIGSIYKTEENPFYKSKYFDINALLKQVEPILDNNQLLLLQPIIEGKVKSIIYDIETGDSVDSFIDLPGIEDPQKMGSAITYYRRYTLQSLLALEAEDDDGNKASGKNVNKPYLIKDSYQWNKAIEYLKNGGNITAIKKKYNIRENDERLLI